MNGSILKTITAAGVGLLALGITTATSLAGEPIIMGTQRVAPDPGQRPRLDERLEQGTALAKRSNPLTDDSGMRLQFMPLPAAEPSRRSQNARDEKANWMMLNRGDLTDTTHSGDLLDAGSMLPESGRRDYFFEKTDGRGLNGRQPLTDKALDLINRPGLAMNNSSGAFSRQNEDGKSRHTDASRDANGSTGGTADAQRRIDEPGLGPLMNPGRVSGAESIERWSSSINQAMQRRKIDGVSDTQTRREQYLDYLGSAQYSGANYPVNSARDKYQREFGGPSATTGGDPRSGLLAPLGGRPITPSGSRPASTTPGGLSPAGIGGLGGNRGSLPGSGNLQTAPEQRRTPSQGPKVDYSAPSDPGSSFNFR